ncbi:hypothetical protein ABFX02_11G048500 [Erythranthe guttata]
MMDASSESDVTSIGSRPSSSSSSRPASAAAYYVESPSCDSQDESNSSNSPMDSPSDPRYSTDSSNSSTAASRVSGGRRRRRWSKHYPDVVEEDGAGGHRRRWKKHYCDVVEEEEADGGDCEEEDDYHGAPCVGDHYDGGGACMEDDYYYDDGGGSGERSSWHYRCILFVLVFGVSFAATCLVFWCAGRPYKPHIRIQSLRVKSLYYGQGSDHTGVPTKFLTVNCSASLAIYNPATFFGIRVTSHTANLKFSQITVASGQLEKYYQPKRSKRVMWVMLVGRRVPLYGAGVALAPSGGRGLRNIPFKLEFEIHSRGYIVGKLVKANHKTRAFCSLLINSRHTEDIIFDENSCVYVIE